MRRRSPYLCIKHALYRHVHGFPLLSAAMTMIHLCRADKYPPHSALFASRTLTFNMVKGVSEGFEKKLQLIGVGYRAAVDKTDLVMNLGYSHPVSWPPRPPPSTLLNLTITKPSGEPNGVAEGYIPQLPTSFVMRFIDSDIVIGTSCCFHPYIVYLVSLLYRFPTCRMPRLSMPLRRCQLSF